VTVVAVCQLGLAVGEVESNRAAAAAAVAESAGQGAELVVLPELCDSGYVFTGDAEARKLATPAADSPTLHEWQALAGGYHTTIAGGFCELGEDGLLYNSAALVGPGGVLAVYRKAHLWDAEKLVFTPGDAPPPVVDLPFGRAGLMICYDLEFPEWVRLAALAGADLIAAPVNWPAMPVPVGERPCDVVRVQADACVNGVFIAVADRCRVERGDGRPGHRGRAGRPRGVLRVGTRQEQAGQRAQRCAHRPPPPVVPAGHRVTGGPVSPKRASGRAAASRRAPMPSSCG